MAKRNLENVETTESVDVVDAPVVETPVTEAPAETPVVNAPVETPVVVKDSLKINEFVYTLVKQGEGDGFRFITVGCNTIEIPMNDGVIQTNREDVKDYLLAQGFTAK